MKKYFLSLFIFSIIAFLVFATQQQIVFAAGEQYTWTGNSIVVTSGNLTKPATLGAASGGGVNNYYGSFNVKDGSSFCQLQIILQTSNQTSGVILATPQHSIPVDHACPANIASQYNNTTVSISGTPPTKGPETNAQKTVEVILQDPNGSSAPSSLTFTIGKQKKTANKSVDNTGTATYDVKFLVDPGNWQVCAPPVLSCQNFTKIKYTPLVLTYGEASFQQSILVTVTEHLVALEGNSCTVGPYAVTLAHNGSVKQTVNTDKASTPGQNTTGGMQNITIHLNASFNKVASGKYQVCVPHFNACKDVTKQDVNAAVAFDETPNDTTSLCSAQGGPSPSLPPPPSPPCAQWGNGANAGQCESFGSAFGDFPTDPGAFIQKIFAILLSLSGGIALLLIIKAGYQLMTSQGKPEQIQQGRDQLIAAIVGLVFLIFSFVFLQLIGFNILHIPGFSDSPGSPNTSICQPSSCIPESLCTAKNPGQCNTNGCPAGKACVQ